MLSSVRLRLLVLALLPLVVLMPLLMVLAMARWNADYDRVLIANVESDLRIAEQYLGQLQSNSARTIQGLADSAALQEVLNDPSLDLEPFYKAQRPAFSLIFSRSCQGTR